MAYATERFFGVQRTLIQTSQDIGLKGLEGATRLFHLHLQTIGHLLGRDGETRVDREAAAASWPYQGTTPPAAPDGRALASYGRQIAEIVSNTNREVSRLLQQHALGWQTLGSEMMNATMRPLTGAGETMQAWVRPPFGGPRWPVPQSAVVPGAATAEPAAPSGGSAPAQAQSPAG